LVKTSILFAHKDGGGVGVMIVTRFKHWSCHSWWERSIHSQFTSRLL